MLTNRQFRAEMARMGATEADIEHLKTRQLWTPESAPAEGQIFTVIDADGHSFAAMRADDAGRLLRLSSERQAKLWRDIWWARLALALWVLVAACVIAVWR